MATNDDTIAEELNVREKASAHEPRIPLAVVVSPGSICGRIRANPLKHLASLLHEKLMAAQGGPCNLLQVQSARNMASCCFLLLLNFLVRAKHPKPFPPFCR